VFEFYFPKTIQDSFTSIKWCIRNPEYLLTFSSKNVMIIKRSQKTTSPEFLRLVEYANISDAGFLNLFNDCIFFEFVL